MITRDTTADYSSLFQKATALLKELDAVEYADVDIQNMDDYFSYIKVLAKIEKGDEGYNVGRYVDPIFTIMPLDEDLFEINANTREIKIPDHFAKYGVGVKGDDVAEIIYFSIARYFDAVDLMDMAILIQWNRGEKDLNQYLDLPYKRSIDYKSDHIVFGWPISKEMTEETGNIYFSVRFYNINDDKLLYSFSTKTATIKIEKSLDFDITPDTINIARAEDRANQIYDNLRESGQSALIPTYMIAAPQFENAYYFNRATAADEFAAMSERSYNLPQQFKIHANLNIEDLNKNKKKSLNGLIYQWYHQDASGAQSLCQDSFIYDLVPEAAKNKNNEYYYYKDAEGNYHLYTGKNPGVEELYFKYSVVTPNAPGYYFARAIDQYNNNNKAETDSDLILIPYPDAIALVEDYATTYRKVVGDAGLNILASTQPENVAAIYEWYYSTTSNVDRTNAISNSPTINADDEGYYQFKAINTFNNGYAETLSDIIHVVYAPSEIIVAPVDNYNVELTNGLILEASVSYASEKGKGTLTYQWQKQNGTSWNNEDEATESTFTPSAIGKYRCVVTNTYEGATATAESGEITVFTLN